jgi:hypothetical protein
MELNLGGMPEGKVQRGRIRCKGEGIIERDVVEIECEAVGWIHLPLSRVQCRILAACFNIVSVWPILRP